LSSWTHHTSHTTNLNRVGSWVEVHTDELREIMKKVIKKDLNDLKSGSWSASKTKKHPYKGEGPNMNIDHLEVFIEKVN